MAIGRISGPLLAKNLLRDGIDLAFETDLLYLDVANGRIGVRKNNPSYELDVNGTINAKNLRVVYTGPGSGKATLGKLEITSGTITTTVGPINIQPSGNETINLVGDTTVTGNLHATGNITADGNITLGNNTATDVVIFESEIGSSLIPAADQQYSLGSQERAWLDAYVSTLVANQLSSTSTLNINSGANLVQINSDLKVNGQNPLGTAPVITNVLFVTMDGNDTNDGRAADASRACKTISGAIRSPYYRPGTLIKVYSGHYLENNPLLLQPNTAVVGDDLRTTSIEPINKTQDLFHVQSGCYIAQVQFYNGRSGLLPGPYVNGTNRGAYCTAFPPQVGGNKIDVYQSPYIQNCTNQSGPWLVDGTMFVPNQTVQIPQAVGTTVFDSNTTTIVVTITTGTVVPGLHVISGPQDVGFTNARTLLLSNLAFIQDQTVAWVNHQVKTSSTVYIPQLATTTNFTNFTYDQAKCYRDVGLILQNVAYDATFGGNEKAVEAGLAYWNGVINLIEGQQGQTTAAINYINTLSQAIITNTTVTNLYSSSTAQIINTALVNGVIASEEITSAIGTIITIINDGPIAAPPIFISCGPETPLVSAELLLQQNRKFLQGEVTAYVDATYPTFEYKKDYCYRDVGLIVDAVAQDIIVGGNTKSIEAALSYYTGGKGDSSVAETAIVNNFNLIKNIIQNGPSVAPDPVSGPNLGTGFSNAQDILLANIFFVQTEVSAYVRSLFDNTFRLTQLQQNLCYRDIGTILTAIAEDTAAGGNVNTVYAGLQYFNGSVSVLPGNQTEKTILTLNYMQQLCVNIIKNIQNTGLYQVLIPQVFGDYTGTDQANAVNANIELITDIITLGPTVVTSLYPISQSMTTDVRNINAFNLLTANKSFLAAELTGWVDTTFSKGFNYNTATCYRDTGLIVDSLAWDLLQQDTSQSIFSGLQYYNKSGYTGSINKELTTTTAAINYAKELAMKVVVNSTVTNLQTATLQVFNLVNPGSPVTTGTVGTLFNTVTNILVNGTAGVTNQIIPNNTASVVTGIVNAYNLLQANKSFIEDEVIAYVDLTTGGFSYDQPKCYRDVGLIVDSLAEDLLFNGSSQSNFSGLQYWAQGSTSIPGELNTTTAAISYVRDLAVKVVVGDTSGTRYQNSVLQITSSTVATVAEQQKVYDEFNLILDIILNGTSGVTDKIIPNGVTISSDPSIQAAYFLLEANKSYLQAEAIAYVTAIKTQGFFYDVNKCYRDVGYMVDSVSFDMLYGGNRQAIQSGVYYYGFDSATTNVPNEQTQVVAAYEYIKTLSSYIIKGQRLPSQYQYSVIQVIPTLVGSNADVAAVNSNVDLIVNIINTGTSAALAPTPISLTSTSTQATINAVNALVVNRQFIQAEVVAYINSTFSPGFIYDRTKCRRDVGYIIDGVSFDLLHGGNRQSVQSGVYYYGFDSNSSVITYELAQITAAYNRIKEISSKIIKGLPVTPTLGNNVTQVTGSSSATDTEVAYIASEINIINDIINNGPSTGYPKTPIKLTSTSTQAVIDAHTYLLANRTFIQTELIAYINYWFAQAGTTSTTSTFVYDKIKCQRDTELIVDSVALDLLYEGNTQSTFAGLQYWSQGTTNIPSEQTTTTNAIAYAQSLVDTLISPYTTSTSVDENFNLIINIINSGTSLVTDLIVPNSLPSTNTGTVAAYNIIQSNKASIQQQTVDWVNTNNPGFVYSTSTCYRDVGYILDCVSFDLLHGGNRQSIQAGTYYYGYSTTQTNIVNEIPQVIGAYNQLKYLINEVLANRALTKTYQVVYPQVLIPAYMGTASVIKGEEVITADAITYLNSISLNVISNTPVPVRRGPVAQTFNTSLDGGQHAGTAVTRNYTIISDVIKKGPNAAPVPFTGSGLFATTGVSSDDVRRSPTILSIVTQTGNTYTLELSEPTVGDSQGGTLYFGNTLVFPATDEQVEEASLKYTGNATTWNTRKVDPIGAMGGSLVDGSVVSDRSPIQSFVYDAFTQVSQGGRGVHVTNNGYAQLVSVFTIFCSVGVQVDNGGIASIVNSNANFGDICLLSNGFGKKEFSGTVYNPPYPSYLPNGEYYPFGYYPQKGQVEVYIPDTSYRPHIALIMEVEPPTTYIDYSGNVVTYKNDQGYPGFLNATPSVAFLTTGSITINDIDTNGIAVGNSVYIRDQYGNTGTTVNSVFTPYVYPDTIVTDVSYRTVTLNQALGAGGADPSNTAQSINADYFNVYFCGNAYYTVLSSTVNDSFGKPLGTNILSSTNVTTTGTDQILPEIASLQLINTTLAGYMTDASVNASAINFVNNCINNIIIPIITATNVTVAETLFTPIKSAIPPAGASLAISVINNNVENVVTTVTNFIATTYPTLYNDTRFNLEKCKRDVRLTLKQLTFELEAGGNYYSIYTGLSYWYRAGTHHIINIEENVTNTALFPDGATVNFYQRSYMSASGYVFEYVGAGVTYSALPQRGVKDPVQGKEVVQVNNGKVFFTSTDQNGDFRIGPELVIAQATGVLSGRTFTKSLFANMTPFILAIEAG
jgi:hypothetical protein